MDWLVSAERLRANRFYRLLLIADSFVTTELIVDLVCQDRRHREMNI